MWRKVPPPAFVGHRGTEAEEGECEGRRDSSHWLLVPGRFPRRCLDGGPRDPDWDDEARAEERGDGETGESGATHDARVVFLGAFEEDNHEGCGVDRGEQAQVDLSLGKRRCGVEERD